MTPGDPAAADKARRILAALRLGQERISDARAPEIERLRFDRPDLTADEADDLYGRACGRLRPWGKGAPGSDPPYPEILRWVDLVRPRPTEPPVALQRRRSGPPVGAGLSGAQVIDGLVSAGDPWPPTEEALGDSLGRTGRRVRQVLTADGKSWAEAIDEATKRRA